MTAPRTSAANAAETGTETVRYLYLMRHAEAAGGRPGTADRDRPLTDAGRRDAVAIGRRLLVGAQMPEAALCSAARRAVETLESVAEGMERTLPSRIEDGLYGTSAAGLLEFVRQSADPVHRLLLVGHNPAVGELAQVLAGQGGAQARAQLRYGFPPGMLALFAVRCSVWEDFHPSHAELRRVVQPADHDA